MIQATELRIGNWVMNSAKEYVQFEVIDKYENYDHLQPIPLTPALLEKCGFRPAEFNNKEAWLREYLRPEENVPAQQLALIKRADDKYSFVVQHRENNMQIAITSIEYLHSLMNLFFALTGTELNITL